MQRRTRKLTDEQRENRQKAVQAVEEHGSFRAAAAALQLPETTLRNRYKAAMKAEGKSPLHRPVSHEEPSVSLTGGDGDCVLTLKTTTIRTLEDALASGHVDLKVWEVDRWTLNKWDVAAKLARKVQGESHEKLTATELWQVKVWFRRRSPEERSVEALLERLAAASPVAAKIKRPKRAKSQRRRSLELSIVDPHLGLICRPPRAQGAWDLETCERAAMWAVDGLLELARPYYPLEEVVFPFGNDFLHVDNVQHTTTKGTLQPESECWHHIYERGERLAIAMVERMKEVAPVRVYEVPGNHDRQSAFTLGRVLAAYYRNDANVEVDASAAPYKFYRYGVNLLGFEHGHSVKVNRLAALMANEAPDDWAATQSGHREWHLGDQHRKGTGRITVMEEQGVSVEFLPGLTPANAWAKVHALTHQKRGAMAFVWDYELGATARLQVNLSQALIPCEGNK